MFIADYSLRNEQEIYIFQMFWEITGIKSVNILFADSQMKVQLRTSTTFLNELKSYAI